MASNRKTKPALFTSKDQEINDQPTPLERREELIASESTKTRHQPQASASLKIKLDQLKTIEPLTKNQKAFFDMYDRGGYFMGLFGSPGVGKTFLACYKSIEEVLTKGSPYKKVVIVRSAVQTRDQGFVPGDLETKQEIFEQPYKEIFANLFNRSDAYTRLKEQGYIRFITTTAIRGISIDDAIIVADECANFSWHEYSTVISRVGYRSKIIFCGDKHQSDLIKSKHDVSGYEEFRRVCLHMDEFQEVFFTVDDIVRSSLVKNFIVACQKSGLLPG